MSESEWKQGDWVVYRKQKSSAAPGPRAQRVFPAGKGEVYHYLVDKYWVVDQLLPDGQLQLRTRRGKQHIVAQEDPRLRRAKWWERWLFANRFPTPNELDADDSPREGNR